MTTNPANYYVWLENQGKTPHGDDPRYRPVRNPRPDGIDTVAIYEEARQKRIAAERFEEHETKGSDENDNEDREFGSGKREAIEGGSD
jgi:hypothetical protein